MSCVEATRKLLTKLQKLKFSEPVTHVYNPLDYAWEAHETYLRRFASEPKKIVFMGMNPGPFGMVQTGIPFGEIAAVRDWMGITQGVTTPQSEHPKRPIEGFECTRSEVSGRRLWGLFAERFGKAEHFFQDHFVLNYCPLAFLEESGRNRTPDKIPADELKPVIAACDQYIREIVDELAPDHLIGVGAFARKRAENALKGLHLTIGQILHPSPASPLANKDWPGTATKNMNAMGLW